MAQEAAKQPGQAAPDSARILNLDVLRGVALLGILLMNILAFGLPAAGYFNPEIGTDAARWDHGLNLALWGLVDVTVEGSMRALFSMLFGAGLVLFTTGASAKSQSLHYRRQLGLLLVGLVDGFLLLWSGDILITYALCGMLLYPLRAAQPRALLQLALVVWLLLVASGAYLAVELERDRSGTTVEAVQQWSDFVLSVAPDQAAIDAELAARLGSYHSSFHWNAQVLAETLLYGLPLFMFWDALLMMLIGMALFRWGVLSGQRSRHEYQRMLLFGGGLGLLLNAGELLQRIVGSFDPLLLFPFLRPTYHLGRLGIALAWLAMVMLRCQAMSTSVAYRALGLRLAAVGRMALSNYLLHSLLAIGLFAGVGLGLLDALNRWQLYLLVILVWGLQLVLSPLWLRYFRQGPVEWLWRWLTYGTRTPLRR
ncbi:MAG: DUF418 domain-containing protein [Pseudomonadales bacterium]